MIDYKAKYEEALERAKKVYKDIPGYLQNIFPELRESEDERMIKRIKQAITGYHPNRSTEEDSRMLAYLDEVLAEKEQKPAEPSIDELQRREDEFYNFKIFAAKQAKEHHVSFAHNFEWNNFCAELLSYFNEKQKPKEDKK